MRSRKGFSYQSKNKGNTNSKSKNQFTFLLVSNTHYGMSIPYNLMSFEIKQKIKTHGALWNQEHKLWMSKLQTYKHCHDDIRKYFQQKQNENNSAVYVNRIPDFVWKADTEMNLQLQIRNCQYSVIRTINYSSIQTSIEAEVLPFYHKLYDFQKQSLNFSIKHHGRLLLADQMGVGKTIQSLAMLSVYRHDWPFLIICPSTLRLNWQQEILNWLGDFIKKTQIQVYNKGGSAIREGIKVLIVSYDLSWKIKDMLQPFKAVIADEAHYLKNSGNKRSDALIPFLSTRKRVILLTGTPAFAKPRQIYNLISIIRPDVFTNFKQFGYRYCQPTINPWSRSMQFNGCQHSKQLYYIIKDKLMIRRLKRQVLTQLPDKQRQRVLVETDKTIIKEIKELINKSGQNSSLDQLVIDMLGNFGTESVQQDSRQTIMKAYTLSGKAKLQSTKQYILELLENNVKLIIFAHHMIILDGLEHVVRQKGYKYMRIDGTVSNQNRHERVQAFQNDQNIKAAILSITAAGVGLTLTAASTVVFAELHWTPGIMIQAQDRAHRIGQKSSVNCHYLIGQNTLDDILYRYLQKKISNVSSFVDGRYQKLQIQDLQKGQRGKFSKVSDKQQKSQSQNKGILFKFQSVKPIIDKYFISKSQDTQISDIASSDSEDIDVIELDFNKTKKSRQTPIIPQEKSAVKNRQSDGEKQKNSDKTQEQKQSRDIYNFVKSNAQELLVYSQQVDDKSDEGTSTQTM